MTGFIVSVFPFRNRVSFKEAFEGLELGEGKLSRPVLRGLGGRKAAWLLGNNKTAPGLTQAGGFNGQMSNRYCNLQIRMVAGFAEDIETKEILVPGGGFEPPTSGL